MLDPSRSDTIAQRNKTKGILRKKTSSLKKVQYEREEILFW